MGLKYFYLSFFYYRSLLQPTVVRSKNGTIDNILVSISIDHEIEVVVCKLQLLSSCDGSRQALSLRKLTTKLFTDIIESNSQ